MRKSPSSSHPATPGVWLVRVALVVGLVIAASRPNPVAAQEHDVSVPFTVATSTVAQAPAASECTADVYRVASRQFNCRIIVRCGRVEVYGSRQGGFGRCGFTPNGGLTFEDQTFDDGDPQLSLRMTPGQPSSLRVVTATWTLDANSSLDTLEAARRASAEREAAQTAEYERERAERQAAARARAQQAIAEQRAAIEDLRALTAYEPRTFYEADQRALARFRAGSDAAYSVSGLGSLADEVDAPYREFQHLLTQRIRDLLPAYIPTLSTRVERASWRDGLAGVDALVNEVALVQSHVRAAELFPHRGDPPDSPDYERTTALLLERLRTLRFEVEDIDIRRDVWCTVAPESIRSLRAEIAQTTGAERRALQQDLADVEANMRAAERFLRDHDITPTQAICAPAPP